MNHILYFNAGLAFIAPIAGRVDINIAIALAQFLVIHRRRVAIAPSLAIELPSRSRRPSPSRRALHHPQFAIAPSIAVVLAVHRRRACAVSRRRGAVAPYLAIKEPSAVWTDDSDHSSHPSQASHPDGCRVASPHATAFHMPAPLIAASPFVPLVLPAGCRVSSLLLPPPPICRCLRLSSRRRLLSHPSRASCPAG
jgi:hypothetical protein